MKIKILAKDFKNTSYFKCSDCAITRALHRAGLKNLEDEGQDICEVKTGNIVLDETNKNYKKLQERVLNMYAYYSYKMNSDTEKPVDFEVDLPLAKYLKK